MAAATPEEHFGQILALLGQNSKGINELKASMEELKTAKADFDQWKPEVNQRVADLEHAVNYLGEKMEQLFGDQSKHALFEGESPIEHPDPDPKLSVGKKATGSAHLEPPPFGAPPGPNGHRHESYHRSAGFEMVYTIPDPPSVAGANKQPNYSFDFHQHRGRRDEIPRSALPDYDFPKFDGSNPRS